VVAKNDGGKRFTATFKADVIDFAHAQIAMVLNTCPYTVLADNSICLNRRAIYAYITSCIMNKPIGVENFKYVWTNLPLIRIGM